MSEAASSAAARRDASPGEARLVTFRFPGDEEVELRGDFRHFLLPIPMERRGGGREVSLRLLPGVYAYKFRGADGRWHLDPHNPRTRAAEGLRNNLLCVGGTDEPVLHAPAAPLLYLEDDGRVRVRAGLRRGAGAGLAVRCFEDGAADIPMRPCGEEDEHLLFEAELPASARRVEYLFVLPEGRLVGAPGGAGQAFSVPRRALRPDAPEWWRRAIVYSIFVDRFRRRGGAWGPAPPSERGRYGGELHGVREALPYLAELGVSVLHLTPLSLARSAHRYDAIDPRVIDPALGGEEALAALCAEAHDRGLRVVLDVGLTHLHRDHAAFRDVRERGPASPYASWFRIRRFPFSEGHDPGYEHYQKGQWQEPLLDLEEEEVREYLAGTVAHLGRLGADGVRIDAAAELPPALLGELRAALRRERPDAALFGEVVPEGGHAFLPAGLDAVTDFGAQRALLGWLLAGGAEEACASLRRRRFWRGGPGWRAVGFTATHDQHRLRTRCGEPARARLGLLTLCCRPEVPLLYYGDEIGLRGDEAGREFEDAWPDRRPMPWDEAAWDRETLALTREALRLRRGSAALSAGDEELSARGEVLVLRRRAGDEVVELYANRGAAAAEVALLAGAPSGATTLLRLGEAEVALSAGQDRSQGTGARDACGTTDLGAQAGAPPRAVVRLGPCGALLLRREAPPETRALWQAVAAEGRRLATAAFLAGSLECASLPSSLYLTVTESCNLRCLHCITDAPARTRQGRARTMKPWVIEALGESLGAADYFGFAHGGESLTAPILWDLLAAIRRARAGRRYDVHLLTNGMLLKAETARRLIDAGVTSLAVSLDGARAEINDAIRPGGRFEEIVDNVRGALRLRAALGADLRVGISTVVTAGNVAELEHLAELALDLGVDWVKVEELYPVNGFGRRQLVPPGDRRAQEGTNRLRRALEPRGVVVVDHQAPPSGCACDEAEVPGLREFRAADDFANRARFHPCSMAWEQACVDPDGTVHAVDYGAPALGRISEAPLPVLWNNEIAQRVRREALRRAPHRLRCPRT